MYKEQENLEEFMLNLNPGGDGGLEEGNDDGDGENTNN